MIDRFSVAGRVAVITGGGTGIGRACALLLAERGATVVVAGLYPQPLEGTANDIIAMGRQALAMACDVTDGDQCQHLVTAVLERFGQIDILVNSAGGGHLKPLEQWNNEAEWHRLMDLNLRSVWQLSQLVAQPMLRQQRGAIVNISSAASMIAMPESPVYAAAKAGVNSLTRTMAAAWRAQGVRVNAIACGTIRAPTLTDEMARLGIAESEMAKLNGAGRLGEPEEIAHGVLFLASDAASFCSGQTLLMNGGPKPGST